jgi:glycosyltransferase involved in cell wall biosynthesis
MKIILDLQSLQTESRFRGIGRYSLCLSKAMIGEGKQHEFYVILNNNFTNSIDWVKKTFEGILSPENILSFSAPNLTYDLDENSQRLFNSAELIREYFIEQIGPDFIHVSSLFEGLDTPISVGCFTQIPTAVTLYDLIPYLHQERYLTDPVIKSHYLRQLDYLRHAELLLAISENTCREAINELGVPAERVINISSDADTCFQKRALAETNIRILRERHKLSHDIVMYTGGIEYRKNIEGLIKAYSDLPIEVRTKHQLVICCKVQDEERRRLEGLASRSGLSRDEMVLTGYISDEDLISLYTICKLFIFPSLYEGFGLPVLEAMRCGAPVIGSNSTSLPEVIGLDEALFNPTSVKSISQLIYQALTDEPFRLRLIENGKLQSQKFSWEISAKRALQGIETVYNQHKIKQNTCMQIASKADKPRLAYFSPIPPERSGISNYSAELLPELAKYYRIDLVNDLEQTNDPWINDNLRIISIKDFRTNSSDYDRILYHFGNSSFHTHMFGLLQRYPGIVMLHDYFLSGVLNYMETMENLPIFQESLYYSHGYNALIYLHENGADKSMIKYPCSFVVLKNAQGIIVHSSYSEQLAREYYSDDVARHMIRIPHLRRMPSQTRNFCQENDRPEGSFTVCSFGFIAQTKLNIELVKAWSQSSLSKNKKCRLIFVGGGGNNKYEKLLRNEIIDLHLEESVYISGYVDSQKYQQYLATADVGVQLRCQSRGESSGTVFDCLAHGLPIVVNKNGTFSELSDDIVLKVNDLFTVTELAGALDKIYSNHDLREKLKEKAIEYCKTELDPERIALKYYEAIEYFAKNHTLAIRKRLVEHIVSIPGSENPTNPEIASIANSIAQNSFMISQKQLLIDVSEMLKAVHKDGIHTMRYSILKKLVENPAMGFRVEPVYHSQGSYHYARRFTTSFLNISGSGLMDSPVEISAGDILLDLNLDILLRESAISWLKYHSQRGLKVCSLIDNIIPVTHQTTVQDAVKSILTISDRVICISRAMAEEIGLWLNSHPVERIKPLKIDCFSPSADIETGQPSGTSILMAGTVELENWAESTEQLKKALFSPVARASWDPEHGFRWNTEFSSNENAAKA